MVILNSLGIANDHGFNRANLIVLFRKVTRPTVVMFAPRCFLYTTEHPTAKSARNLLMCIPARDVILCHRTNPFWLCTLRKPTQDTSVITAALGLRVRPGLTGTSISISGYWKFLQKNISQQLCRSGKALHIPVAGLRMDVSTSPSWKLMLIVMRKSVRSCSGNLPKLLLRSQMKSWARSMAKLTALKRITTLF